LSPSRRCRTKERDAFFGAPTSLPRNVGGKPARRRRILENSQKDARQHAGSRSLVEGNLERAQPARRRFENDADPYFVVANRILRLQALGRRAPTPEFDVSDCRVEGAIQ